MSHINKVICDNLSKQITCIGYVLVVIRTTKLRERLVLKVEMAYTVNRLRTMAWNFCLK